MALKLQIFSLRVRPRFRWRRGRFILFLVLLIALIILIFSHQKKELPWPVETGGIALQKVFSVNKEGNTYTIANPTSLWLKEILQKGLPFFSRQNNQALTGGEESFSELWDKYARASQDPRAVVGLEMGWLPALERTGWELLIPVNTRLFAAPTDSTGSNGGDIHSLPAFSVPEVIDSIGGIEITEDKTEMAMTMGSPLIAIYCTHNAETYYPTAGKSRVEGEKGGVDQVARVLKRTLENDFGIPTVYVDTIHDYPDWSKSYANSAQTVQSLLNQYLDLQILVDVHRDALPTQEPKTIDINGQKTALLLFFVGSDERREHPHWKKNLALAQQIANILEAQHPGICRGVRVKAGAYNQHLHPGAILIEVGNDHNSLPEAERAAIILAGALKEALSSL